MKDLFEVAKGVQTFLDARGWQSCIIGGDVKGIVARQIAVDWEMIYAELTPLCELKDAPEILTQLKPLQKGAKK